MPFLVLRKVLELCLLGSPYQLFCPLQSYVHLCFGPTATYFNQLSQCSLESLAPLPSCPPESCLDLPRRVWTPPHCASHTTSSPHLPRKASWGWVFSRVFSPRTAAQKPQMEWWRLALQRESLLHPLHIPRSQHKVAAQLTTWLVNKIHRMPTFSPLHPVASCTQS